VVGGFFNEIYFGAHLLKGHWLGFRDQTLTIMLSSAIDLAPINIFLYTWSFINTLERDTENNTMKSIYKWFARISVVLIPVVFYALYAASSISGGMYVANLYKGNKKEV